MNQQAYDLILAQMEPVLKHKNFEKQEFDGMECFANGEKVVRVEFVEEQNLFELKVCKQADGVPDGSWETLSSWLFLPDYADKDAKSIGNDFSDSLKILLGMSAEKSRSKIDLPSKGAPGDTPTLETLTQKFLTIFPQYKEKYKDHVAQHGECLYVEFFEEYGATHLRTLLRENKTKQLPKYMEILNEVYTLGNKDAQAMVSRVILGEAIDGDPELKKQAESYMEEYPYLKKANDYMFQYLRKHNKKKKA